MATALTKSHGRDSLYYWTSTGTAEVDFIVSYENAIYPLEVKSSTNEHLKSLHVYQERYHPSWRARASLHPFEARDRFINYPLYLVQRFPLFTE